MKHTFKYILIGLSLLGVSVSASAQMAYNEANGIRTGKQVTGPNTDGSYTITLETYAIGESDFSEKTSDIVLVLDMSGSMTEPVGATTNLGSTSLSYNDVVNGDVEYFIRAGGYWEKIYGERNGSYYYLYCRPSDPLYLTNYGTQGSRPYSNGNGRANSASNNIVTNVTGLRSGTSKINALQTSVKTFIGVVNTSDKTNSDQTPRTTRLGNRMAIVTFESGQNTVAEWTLLGNAALDVNNNSGYNSLISAIDNLPGPAGGTNAHLGMNTAVSLMNSSSAGNKTIVLFTDGIPGTNGSWNQSGINSANNTINYANNFKGTDGKNGTVWTVGVFTDLSGSDKTNTDNYMSRVSSNYVNVTNMTTTATAVDSKYYIQATSASALEQIFADIASESTKHETVDSSTQVKDVISSSFALPEGIKPEDITLKIADFKSTGNGWENERDAPSTVKATITEMQKLDESGQPAVDEDGNPIMLNTVQVQGFDYTKNDSSPTSFDGHWVGPRKVQGKTTYAGKKVIISFNIVQVEDVTGGVGTNTNTSQSGVYVFRDGEYQNLNSFVVPHTTLPINLKIKKSGLLHGESATFEIERCRPKNWVETRSLQENINAMEYNALGKPVPSKADDAEWENWSKVIVTNKGKDFDPVEKMIIALDPYYVYKISEDTWSWAYDAVSTAGQSHENTSTVEVNPFNFKNIARTGEDIPKHAEAVTINHFNFTIEGGKQEEHYRSSKGQFQN